MNRLDGSFPYRLPPGKGTSLREPRHLQRDIGNVISHPNRTAAIAGFERQPGELWPDDRGCSTERVRFGSEQSWLRGLGPHVRTSSTLSHPGVIKALHYHRYPDIN